MSVPVTVCATLQGSSVFNLLEIFEVDDSRYVFCLVKVRFEGAIKPSDPIRAAVVDQYPVVNKESNPKENNKSQFRDQRALA